MNTKSKALAKKAGKKMSPFEKATGNCDNCGSSAHKTSGHQALVKSGKITR